jgi:hypothetical protein
MTTDIYRPPPLLRLEWRRAVRGLAALLLLFGVALAVAVVVIAWLRTREYLPVVGFGTERALVYSHESPAVILPFLRSQLLTAGGLLLMAAAGRLVSRDRGGRG